MIPASITAAAVLALLIALILRDDSEVRKLKKTATGYDVKFLTLFGISVTLALGAFFAYSWLNPPGR